MATRPIVHGIQDMPPPGGYPPINFTRNLRPRGPSGFMIWGMVIGATVWGFYNHITNVNKPNLVSKAENRKARMATYPFFNAECDRRGIAQLEDVRNFEIEVMKHDPTFDPDERIFSKRNAPTQYRF